MSGRSLDQELAPAVMIFVLPLAMAAILAGFGFGTWHGWLIGALHGLATAGIGCLWGAWLASGPLERSFPGKARLRAFGLTLLTLAAFALLYPSRPLPPSSFDNGMWRLLMLSGFMGGARAGITLARRRG
ncbi:MAG TPA: hypothetical protein VD886_04560 [Herpetosiphonaceae bacterium]|nr:hypothetical protein [Herpetosiphonaceae bacterium]